MKQTNKWTNARRLACTCTFQFFSFARFIFRFCLSFSLSSLLWFCLVSARVFFSHFYSAFVYGNSDKAIEKPILCLLPCIAYQTHAHNTHTNVETHTHSSKICYGRKSAMTMTAKRTMSKSKRKRRKWSRKNCLWLYISNTSNTGRADQHQRQQQKKPCTKLRKSTAMAFFASFRFFLLLQRYERSFCVFGRSTLKFSTGDTVNQECTNCYV